MSRGMDVPAYTHIMIMALVPAVFACAAGAQSRCPSPLVHGARLLPSVFDEGRVLAAPTTVSGDTAYFILDSGGGFNAVAANRVAAMKVSPHVVGSGGDTASVVALASFVDSLVLPAPTAGYPSDGSLVVSPEVNGLAAYYTLTPSGFLGGGWWADRVWQIDYLRRQLWLYSSSVLIADATNAHQIALGYKSDRSGVRRTNFPRLRALIDGDSVDLLFDTGAMTRFTDSALVSLGDRGPSKRAGSFMSSEVFDRWRARHPDWRVVERGEVGTRQALIEVPSMELAGYTVGPVIWERRERPAFHKLMDPLMDRQIQGALGGAALQFFSITIDYRTSLACFTQ